jgi:hypothetical protein
MGRGKHFNHMKKGHDPEIPKHGHQVQAKRHDHAVYDIEQVAKEGSRPVTIQVVEE